MDRDRRRISDQLDALRCLSYAIVELSGRPGRRNPGCALIWISKATRHLHRRGLLSPADRARLAAAYAVAEDAAKADREPRHDR